ncbi:MAG TPA: glycosyltransferase family 4 protein, partial [Patescibacteria group bacterium]
KMQILNRLLVDAHYLLDLENKLKGYDIVHTAETYYHYTQQALLAKKKGYVKKVVATVLENIPFNNEGIIGRKRFKDIAKKELDHIIALTQRTRDALLVEGVSSEKITVVSHGIDTQRFVPDKDFVKRQTQSKESIKILFSGRLEKYKGVFDILYAAKLLLLDKELNKYKIEFIFVGDGSERNEMLKMEEKLGIKSFVNHKSVDYTKMPEQYKNADIFLAPSKADKYWEEQYCTALLEAQSAGLPIITTMSGGIPENIGEAGILVPPGGFTQLYLAIKDLILHPNLRGEFAQKARKRALAVHDVKHISQQLDTIYQKVLKS